MPFPALLLSIALVSQAPPIPAPQQQRFERIFISPMGEPFRASQPVDDPLVDWFKQADSNHDGSLSLLEFANDGARFFRALDTDHDGQIGFDEFKRRKKGGNRNDPGRNRCGCFLPDLTRLATAPSARLPRRIWAMSCCLASRPAFILGSAKQDEDRLTSGGRRCRSLHFSFPLHSRRRHLLP